MLDKSLIYKDNQRIQDLPVHVSYAQIYDIHDTKVPDFQSREIIYLMFLYPFVYQISKHDARL